MIWSQLQWRAIELPGELSRCPDRWWKNSPGKKRSRLQWSTRFKQRSKAGHGAKTVIVFGVKWNTSWKWRTWLDFESFQPTSLGQDKLVHYSPHHHAERIGKSWETSPFLDQLLSDSDRRTEVMGRSLLKSTPVKICGNLTMAKREGCPNEYAAMKGTQTAAKFPQNVGIEQSFIRDMKVRETAFLCSPWLSTLVVYLYSAEI